MGKIAVISTGGKQYKVKAGEIIKVEKLSAEPKESVNFETLMISNQDGSDLKLGKPVLAEKISGEVISTDKDKKVEVVKYKNKIRYKRTIGHRQLLTRVKIQDF
jgi:large subunit ribosomal protein L21